MLAVVAFGVALWAMSRNDTGPEVGERARRAERAPAFEPVDDPAPAAATDEQPAPRPGLADRPGGFGGGARDPRAPLRPMGNTVQSGAGLRGGAVASGDAAATTTGRRITMSENLFRAAARAVPPGPDQDAVQTILDRAIEQMQPLEAEVREGTKTYRDAVDQMNALRDEAAAAIDGILPPDEASAVKTRMGVRETAPEPLNGEDVPGFDWGQPSGSLEEAFRNAE